MLNVVDLFNKSCANEHFMVDDFDFITKAYPKVSCLAKMAFTLKWLYFLQENHVSRF